MYCKKKVFRQLFVAFSDYMNFNEDNLIWETDDLFNKITTFYYRCKIYEA
jgi:hypothetical protein